MSKSLESIAVMTANFSGFIDTYAFIRRKLSKSQIVIVMYHRVCPEKDYWSSLALNTQSFEQQIEYFSSNFKVVPLGEIAQLIHQRRPFPKKAVVITFDDGYKDNYSYAYPILKKYGVPATIFLTAGYIGSDKLFWWDKISYLIHHTQTSQLHLGDLGSHRFQSIEDRHYASHIIIEHLKKLPDGTKDVLMNKLLDISQVSIPSDLGRDLFLSWEEVKEMSKGGIDFGAHTVSHPILTNIPLKQAQDEIIQSKMSIEDEIEKEVTIFSYPNGNFNSELVRFIKENGFTCAVSTSSHTHSKPVHPSDNPYTLSRIDAIDDFVKFKVMLSGLWGDARTILTRRPNEATRYINCQ